MYLTECVCFCGSAVLCFAVMMICVTIHCKIKWFHIAPVEKLGYMSRINYSDSEGGAPQTIVACELIQQACTWKHDTHSPCVYAPVYT